MILEVNVIRLWLHLSHHVDVNVPIAVLVDIIYLKVRA